MVYLIKSSHRRAGRWNDVVDKEKKRVFGAQMNTLANQEVELTDGKVRRYEVLLLVQITDPGLRSLLDDHLVETEAC